MEHHDSGSMVAWFRRATCSFGTTLPWFKGSRTKAQDRLRPCESAAMAGLSSFTPVLASGTGQRKGRRTNEPSMSGF